MQAWRLLLLSAFLFVLAAPAWGAKQKNHVSWPAHHQLWLCIHAREAGSWSATNGQYRGGLQMHLGWGYGSSYDAAQDSQWRQETSAERAYAASGYSRAWLSGQWLSYDGGWGCLQYA